MRLWNWLCESSQTFYGIGGICLILGPIIAFVGFIFFENPFLIFVPGLCLTFLGIGLMLGNESEYWKKHKKEKE